MSFHQFIQYKALDRMYDTDNDTLLDLAIRDPRNEEQIKVQMKNVCALISRPLFDDLEEICGLLEISKRKFIEGALIEAIAQATKIVDEVGLHEHFSKVAEQYGELGAGGELAMTATVVEDGK